MADPVMQQQPWTGGQQQQPNNTYLQPGQTPMELDPFNWGQGQWQGPGGGATAQNFYAASEFNKMFGRNPSQSELAQFAPYYASGDPNRINQTNGNQAISSYFNQQQQAANAPQQEAAAMQAQYPIIQDLINKQMTGAIQNITDPNSAQYQQFAGNMNNMGITPSSGAFQSGLGSAIGNAENSFMSQALGQVGLPIASGYSQGAMQPFNDAMGQPGQQFSNNLQLQDFLTQSQMGQQMAEQMQGKNSFLNYLPGMLQGGGQAAGGAAQLKQSGATWICTAMVKHGVMTKNEVNALHDHLFKAFWSKPFKFLGYFLFGKLLVWLAESADVDWKVWKPSFYQDVMAEPDPVKAVALYESAFWNLYIVAKQRRSCELLV